MLLRTTSPNRFRIYARFVRYLLWEFRWPLGVFTTLVLGGGLVLHLFYHHEYVSYPKACYAVFLLIFMQSGLEFPDEWYLQPFFFLVPIVGLGAVADSVVRLAFLMFTQKQKLPEWQRMVASLYRRHAVVVGVGKVGYQIISGLLELGEPVVAIDQVNDTELARDLLDRGVPLIQGNGRNPKTLEQAGVAAASSVIFATSDDLANLDGGLTARDLNPGARVILRLFDISLAAKVAGAFALPAISTAKVSAPAFIAAATGRKVYQELELAGQRVHLTDLTILPGSRLVGQTVGAIQASHQVNIVMHNGPGGVHVNPAHGVALAEGDTLLLIAPIDRLAALETLNRSDAGQVEAPLTLTPATAPDGRALAPELEP